MMKRLICGVSLVFLLWPGTAVAATFASGESPHVNPSDTVTDDYYAAGSEVVVEGTVNGDVVVAGNTIRITGTVAGDVWASGNTVEITGRVNGTVRAAGAKVIVRGQVREDVMAAGSDVRIEGGSVGRDVWAAGNQLYLGSTVARHIHAESSRLNLGGTVTGDVDVKAEDNLTVTEGTVIQGTLNYTADQEIGATPGSRLGTVNFRADSDTRPSFVDRVTRQAYWFLAAMLLLTGILMYARRGAWVATSKLTAKPWWSLLAGSIFFVAVPLVSIVLLVSVVGALLGVFTLGLYVLVLYTAKIFPALLVGRILIQRNPESFWLSLAAGAIGLVFYYVLAAIPIVGAMVGALVLLFGIGAQLLFARELYGDVRAKYGSS